jgi:hypothetical protein
MGAGAARLADPNRSNEKILEAIRLPGSIGD